MGDLARIRALAGLKEASVAQVINPNDDFYKLPGFRPRYPSYGTDVPNVVDVPVDWDQKGAGGGGGGSSAGAQGSTGNAAPTKPEAPTKAEPSTVTPDGVEVVTPDADLRDYFAKIDQQIAKKDKDSGTLPGPELELPKIQTPSTDKPVDPDYKKDDAEVVVIPPGNRPPPLDFSEPKQDMSKLPGQGGPGAETNPLVITPKKKEPEPEPEPEKVAPSAPVVPTRPTTSQMFGGGISPSKEEPKKEPPKEEPKAEKPKIAAPSAAPVAVAPAPVVPPKEEPKVEKPKIPAPSAVPAPEPKVTFPAPIPAIPVKPSIPGPSAAPAPMGSTSGSGSSSSGFGSGSSTGQGTGQGSGQGSGSGAGQGSGTGGGSGSGSGTGQGSGEGPGGQWKDHHWFRFEVGGRPAPVPPNQLPPGWKHLGNGQYVSEKPRSAYGPNEEPKFPRADNQHHADSPDWSKQYYKENTQHNQEINHLKILSGIREETPQPSLSQAFGGGISSAPKPPAAQDDQQSDKVNAGHIIQPPVQQPKTTQPDQPQQMQPLPQQQQQSDTDSPEYIKRYKSGARQPPLVFQEPSYGGPIVGPGHRGPVYRGPNPYGAFGQGRR